MIDGRGFKPGGCMGGPKKQGKIVIQATPLETFYTERGNLYTEPRYEVEQFLSNSGKRRIKANTDMMLSKLL